VFSGEDSREKVFKKNESVVSRKIADEILLVPVRGTLVDMQRIFSLNPVAEHVWERLDGKRNLENIRDSILDDFDIRKEQAEADLSDFVAELLEANLIIEVQ